VSCHRLPGAALAHACVTHVVWRTTTTIALCLTFMLGASWARASATATPMGAASLVGGVVFFQYFLPWAKAWSISDSRRCRPRRHFLPEGVTFKFVSALASSSVVAFDSRRLLCEWRWGFATWSRSCCIRGYGSATMAADEPPSSWTGLFRMVVHLLGVGRRFKLVGEESKLSHVGCVEAWQRQRTAIFLILCWCLVVGVVMFFGYVWPVLRSRSCMSLRLTSATITLDGLCVRGSCCRGCLCIL
jgi:hypothetical protein